MKFFTAIVALGSAALAAAQASADGPNAFKVPDGGYQTSAGSSLSLSWTPTTQGTVSLYLRSGNAAYLSNGTAIATGLANNGQYTWHVPDNTVRCSNCAIEIVSDQDTSEFNFTPPFIIDSQILTASVSGLASTTLFTSSATNSAASVTTSGSTSGSSAIVVLSASSSASTTASASVTHSTAAPLTQSTGGAPRATLVAGMLGAVALGALAL